MADKLSAPLGEFKEREIEIIELMAQGASNQEIADKLFITKETVRWYNKQIYSKLGTSRRTEAILLANEMGLIGNSPTPEDTQQAIRHTPPVTTGPFTGRDEEMAELSDLLQSPDIRLLSIVATGGMGKSRLSLELGHLIKQDYEHGVAFIDLTAIRNPDDIATLALSSLGLSINGNKLPEDVLFNYCREKELLLIFDNFEHVLSGARLLAGILEIAPNVKIIATSRERLNLRVETTFYLQAITESGDKLFLEIAEMMHPHLSFTEDEQEQVRDIVQLVGGSPLALILAATWLDTFSIPEIAEEIDANLDFLSAEMGDIPERQRSIHAVIEPTWKRLSDEEQKAFMWASVFRGGFTRQTFQTITATSARTLQSLLNRSLIHHGFGRRYDMHPLVRQFAREKLEIAGSLFDAKAAHLNTFLEYAQAQAEMMYDGENYLESLEALALEQDNFRAALDWSMQGNHIDQGVELILANGDFWLARSMSQEAMTYIEKAIQHADHPKLHYWRSTYLDRLGQIDQSIESARYVIEAGETTQNNEILAYGQMRLAQMTNKTDARPLLESAFSNALETGNQNLIADCHSILGLLHSVSQADSQLVDEVNMHYQKALEIYETTGDLRGISRVTNNIAISYYDSGERRQDAKDMMDYSLQLKRKIGDRAGEARRLTTLSLWAIEEEEFELAQEWLVESRKICEELGELDRLSYTLTIEGLSSLLMMDFERAQAILGRSLDIHLAIKDYRGAVDIYGFLGQIYLLQKDLTNARLVILKGVETAKDKHSSPAILIIIYANYLWQNSNPASIPLVATLAQQKLNTYSGSETIVNTYFLQPLIYRIQQTIGDEAWQQALTQAATVTVEDCFQDILAEIENT